MTGEERVRSGRAVELTQVLRPRAQVERQVREAIMSGDLSPGDKLPPETELARQFRVSRPTVREALGSLVAAGFIRSVSGVAGGYLVNSVTSDSLSSTLNQSLQMIVRLGSIDLDELVATRRVLEVRASSWAAKNGSSQQVAALQDILERPRPTVDDTSDSGSNCRDLHVAVARASGNRLLAAFVSAMYEVTNRVELVRLTTTARPSIDEQHLAIVEAVRSGSPHKAGCAMEQHLDNAVHRPAGAVGTEWP